MSTTTTADPAVLVKEAIGRVTAIATLPEVTSRIISTVENPQSTASQLHKIIAHDPALVTRILKVVNSAFYGLPGQIASIERAIVLLGLNAVKNLAVAASLGQMFKGSKLCEGFTARDLWTHCVAVAVATREMARQMKLPLVDEAFLAGMIHDVGILVELQVFPEQLREVCDRVRQDGGDFCALEREVIGVDHQQMGTALAEQWKFPLTCRLVAAHHHRPMALPEEQRLLVALVHVADVMCAEAELGFNLSAISQRLDEMDLADLKMDPRLVSRVRESLDSLMDQATAVMG
jgi:putative nucleotidyltransferase with HDIG domain